jgi:hypothetical protein
MLEQPYHAGVTSSIERALLPRRRQGVAEIDKDFLKPCAAPDDWAILAPPSGSGATLESGEA